MALPQKTTLKFRLIATMALMLITLTAALAFVSARNMHSVYYRAVDVKNDVGMRTLIYSIANGFNNMRYEEGSDGRVIQAVWPIIPRELEHTAVDDAQSVAMLDSTIFRLEPSTGDFMRIATTLVEPNGDRSIGTPLDRNEVYGALSAGLSFIGPVNVRGTSYQALYVPVFDTAGTVNGALAMIRPLAEVRAVVRFKVLQTVGIAVVVLTLILLAGLYTIRRLLAPLGEVTQSIVILSDGNLTDEIDYTDRHDEIGAISKSLVVLQASMQHSEDLQAEEAERAKTELQKSAEQQKVVELLSAGLGKLAELDFTTRIESNGSKPFPAEYDSLRLSFNKLVDRLSETIEAISVVTDEVNRDAREMADSSNDLSSRTDSQAATLQQSAAALEELSESVQSTAANASEAEATTTENRAVAKQTGDIVDNAVVAMEAIEASSKQITQIISVIDDIAFQTNLLALNAGVEAARAGEAGRGFAVVASEVRALAQHSSASAQEIKTLIAASSEQVENGSKLVRATGQSLGDIISRVDRVAGLVSDIAISAKEQSVGVSEINSGVRDLDAATQRNAAMAEEASAASEGLTSAADRLASHLGRFQIAKVSGTPNWAAAAASRPSITTTPVAVATPIMGAPRPIVAQAASPRVPQGNVFRDF